MAPPLLDAAKRFIGYPEKKVPTASSKEWIQGVSPKPTVRAWVVAYLYRLFPILSWIGRYNLGWLSGDLIAGITVGIVLVPQSMSYAQIATLAPEFGLYSAFVGVFIYCFFATSKDVSIGPVAVMSLTVSQIIKHVNNAHPNEFKPEVIATAVAFICGFIVLGIGLLRLGWIVEFIPAPAVSGFMTGSAINIVAGQVPGLMGITGFEYAYCLFHKVIINTLKGLPRTKLDAAFGIPGLVALYGIRITFDLLTKRYPQRARLFFFLSIMRNGFVLIVLTIASWLYTRHRKSKKGTYPIKILQTVPRGFKHVGQPRVDSTLLSAIAGELPVATVILLLEHIAISKSFGRVNNYTIDPNQELVAIGVTNTVGSVFNAYPATGSFSRSALKSKCGVRTPIAGWFTGIVVVVALYGLTAAFFWIPTAALSAIIIHAVADLVAKPKQVYAFWAVSPLESIIWWATVFVTVFSSIENGIYTAIIASLVLLLLRVAHPRESFLGRVVLKGDRNQEREVYVPLSLQGEKNSQVQVRPPIPGVIIYRFEESLLYPNSSLLNSSLINYVKKNTRRGKTFEGVALADRPWNDPGPRRGEILPIEEEKPVLRAIVLDFSGISQIDTTGVQALVDTRGQVERWADRHVEFHFANVLSPWIRRALVAGGFGTGALSSDVPVEVAPIVPLVADIQEFDRGYPDNDPEAKQGRTKLGAGSSTKHNGIVSSDTPYFHFDLASAVKAAEAAASLAEKTVSNDADDSSFGKRFAEE